ncbi:MAG: replicative DNA helicase [Actinomycetaceae bacterium]|nr:replicative DNA helicase [Actinomycetaceae bacterium]
MAYSQENTRFDRTPPQNIEAEMSVLGALLLSKDAIADVEGVIDATDFYKAAHATIFRIIRELFAKGEPADPVTVAGELDRRGDLDRVGGLPYLHTLSSSVPTAANALYYANIVREQSQLRALVETGTRIAQLGYSTDGTDADKLISAAQEEVYAISSRRGASEYVVLQDIIPDLEAEVRKNMESTDTIQGVPTGFKELDGKLNGLRSGQMIIIAARPGAGKSTLAMDICRNSAIKHKMPTAYFSLEMNRNELTMRILSAESGIFHHKMVKGDIKRDEWAKISATLSRISTAPLLVDDSPGITLAEIRAKCRRMKQQYNLKLIVIDYLQLIESSGRTESRQQEVSGFSRSIKLLAKELDVPIIAVAQLNRDSEKRDNKRPQVSDLRESGSLEQDADVILLIHRDDLYKPQNERQNNAEIIIGKQRSGPTGSIELGFLGSLSRFSDYVPSAVAAQAPVPQNAPAQQNMSAQYGSPQPGAPRPGMPPQVSQTPSQR